MDDYQKLVSLNLKKSSWSKAILLFLVKSGNVYKIVYTFCSETKLVCYHISLPAKSL